MEIKILPVVLRHVIMNGKGYAVDGKGGKKPVCGVDMPRGELGVVIEKLPRRKCRVAFDLNPASVVHLVVPSSSLLQA